MGLSLIRLLTALIYGIIGLLSAFPLSYFFQSAIFKEMSLSDYLVHGEAAIVEAAQFGAISVVRYTTIATVITSLLLGKFIEGRLAKLRQRQHRQ